MIELERYAGPLANQLEFAPTDLNVYWLGQAGFLVRSPKFSFLIDPYLSDRLAEKYRGGAFPHERLMAPPITVADAPRLDFVVCTHHHGDHLDPPTIHEIASKFPQVRFIVPAPCELELDGAGVKKEQIILAEADREIRLAETLTVLPLKAAHEKFEFDELGRHRFLGYLIQVEGALIYHSGDTVRYPGLVETLARQKPQLALLPVNGRRPELSEKGVAGNFTLEEAVQLCLDAGIPTLIAHHFGMFAFNTIDPKLIDQSAVTTKNRLQIIKAELATRYILKLPPSA
jgi:L-ascorbate metabolism protein UlaG (beta-lactamase superfamily)